MIKIKIFHILISTSTCSLNPVDNRLPSAPFDCHIIAQQSTDNIEDLDFITPNNVVKEWW